MKLSPSDFPCRIPLLGREELDRAGDVRPEGEGRGQRGPGEGSVQGMTEDLPKYWWAVYRRWCVALRGTPSESGTELLKIDRKDPRLDKLRAWSKRQWGDTLWGLQTSGEICDTHAQQLVEQWEVICS